MTKNSSKIVSAKNGNSVQSSPSFIWSFTFNNYDVTSRDSLACYFSSIGAKYIMGYEVGEQGTPHIQGHVEFKKKLRLTALKKIDIRIHWERTRNIDASRDYCKKDGDYVTNMCTPRLIKFPTKWYKWQQDIIDLVDNPDRWDDRSIHWFWETTGNVGKTTLVRYLVGCKNALLLPSKSTDCFHALAKRVEANQAVNICIFDIPRSSLDFVSYQAIEKVKDGCVVSGKYEGCLCLFKSPLVLVFANEEPNYDMLSLDRLKSTLLTP